MTAAVARFAENRATIEQTKGMSMLLYGVDESTADAEAFSRDAAVLLEFDESHELSRLLGCSGDGVGGALGTPPVPGDCHRRPRRCAE
jgi:hypothetical protein